MSGVSKSSPKRVEKQSNKNKVFCLGLTKLEPSLVLNEFIKNSGLQLDSKN